jgi:hypothetical protein
MSDPSTKLFEKNWSKIVMSAQMARVQKPRSGIETITVEKDVYDDILRLADYVVELQKYGENAEHMEARKTASGFEVVLNDKAVGDVFAQGGHLLQAMKEASQKRHLAMSRLVE